MGGGVGFPNPHIVQRSTVFIASHSSPFIYPLKSGYPHSTTTVNIKVTNDLVMQFNSQFSVLLLLAFSAAFDTGYEPLLLSSLFSLDFQDHGHS